MPEPTPLHHLRDADPTTGAASGQDGFTSRLASLLILLALAGGLMVLVGAVAKVYWLLLSWGWSLL